MIKFPFLVKIPYFHPDDTGVVDKPILGIKPEKSDDDTALLDSLIGDKDIIDLEEKDKDDEEKPDDEEAEIVEEDPLLDVDTNARGLDLTKIKEKYPDFAKTHEFRELKNAYYRETKYTELFPTIEDAKEAAENNETFNKLNTDLVSNGDVSSLLSSVKEANPEAYKKIATSFLDTVSKMDKDTYIEVISPVVRRLAKQIYDTGKKHLSRNADSDDGKALVATANNILHYAFPDDDIDITKDEPKPSNEPSEKEKDLTKREQAIATEKFNSAYTIAANSVEHNLDKAILNGLDPDNKLNEFTRDALVEKIKKEVQGQISADTIHVGKMGSLWKRANSEGYSRESLSRIVTAYLERARPIIPTVRNKYRSIAIKGKTNTDDSGDKDIRLVSRGRSGRAPDNDGKTNMKRADPKKIDYRNTTDDDIFDGKIKLKG